jgi:hypothetical protein
MFKKRDSSAGLRAKALSDIGSNGNSSTHLMRQAVPLPIGKRFGEMINRQHELMRFLPHRQIAELYAAGRRVGMEKSVQGICLIYLKLFERIYAPLINGVLARCQGDEQLPTPRRTQLDRLYDAVLTALGNLVDAVGLKAA